MRGKNNDNSWLIYIYILMEQITLVHVFKMNIHIYEILRKPWGFVKKKQRYYIRIYIISHSTIGENTIKQYNMIHYFVHIAKYVL
jgi:hypothetical protein